MAEKVDYYAQVNAILGSDIAPSYFNPDDFKGKDFDSYQYIQKMKKYVPIELCKEQCENHLAEIKQQLTSAINDEYQEFIGLSGKLQHVDGAVTRLQQPLSTLKSTVSDIRQQVVTGLQELESHRQERVKLAASRNLLEALQSSGHTLSKIEQLLSEITIEKSEDTKGQREVTQEIRQERIGVVERVAAEMARLMLYTSKAQSIAYARGIQPRIQSCKQQLLDHTRALLYATLQQYDTSAVSAKSLQGGDTSSIQRCMEVAGVVDSADVAEQCFREVVVRGLIQGEVEKMKEKGPPYDLLPLLKYLPSTIAQKYGVLINNINNSQTALKNINLIGKGIIAELGHMLNERLLGIYSPGHPVSFVHNYAAYMQFLKDIEVLLCSNTYDVIMQLRNSDVYQQYVKKWKLHAYYTIKFKDIGGTLEAALPTTVLKPRVPTPPPPPHSLPPTASALLPQLYLHACTALVTCMYTCTHSDVYIPQLADKFLECILRCSTRFTTSIHQGLLERAKATQAQKSTSVGGPAPAAMGMGTQGGGKAEGAGGAEGEQEENWAVSCSSVELVMLAHDIFQVQQHYENVFMPQTVDLVAGGEGGSAASKGEASSSVRGVVQSAMSTSAESLGTCFDYVIDYVTDMIATQCAEGLRSLRMMATTYRMSNRPPPQEASHYVAGLLQDMHVVLNAEKLGGAGSAPSGAQTHLAQSVRGTISRKTIHKLTLALYNLVTELLESARKTRSSLMRLKKQEGPAVGGGGGEGGGLSDVDKMRLQVYFDLQAFADLAISNGVVDYRESEGYKQVYQIVEDLEGYAGGGGGGAV